MKRWNPVVLEPERFAAGVGPRVAPSVDAAMGDAALQQVWCQSVCLSVQPSAVLRLSPDPRSLGPDAQTGNGRMAVAYRKIAASSGRRLLASRSATTATCPKPAVAISAASSSAVKWWVA